MKFLALHNQGDGWANLCDIRHKGSQMLLCLSASCSSVSPCVGGLYSPTSGIAGHQQLQVQQILLLK